MRALDLVTDGPKPDLVPSLGATYHHESLAASGLRADVAVECSGAADAVVEVIKEAFARHPDDVKVVLDLHDDER